MVSAILSLGAASPVVAREPAQLTLLDPSSTLVLPSHPLFALPVPPLSLTASASSPSEGAEMAGIVVSHAPTADGDVEMTTPPRGTEDAPADSADTRPTMATLLSQQENIRRDTTAADAARRRVETPKPLALNIEAIERQYVASGDWSGIGAHIIHSRPYPLPRAKFDMVIETGKAFTKTPLQKIMAALVSKTHGNPVLDQLYTEFLVGQGSKMPGRNLRLKVKTQAACLLLERTTVSILGGVYPFRLFDVLPNKFYLDISNVDSDADTNLMLYRLFVLGCQRCTTHSAM
ncbi:unnamed protein product [Peronospora destructor]|uniref:Uncharacterized protein n=1 Tax=Peronospora destructor TaxID=86335 RepID=A0AAV0T360_9STRA|nr:unnamed protein product [Peronospora destructor]